MDTLLGLLFWVLVCYPIWSPRCRRIRKAQDKVSRNHRGARTSTVKTGPRWEQDSVWPEVFEGDDDL